MEQIPAYCKDILFEPVVDKRRHKPTSDAGARGKSGKMDRDYPCRHPKLDMAYRHATMAHKRLAARTRVRKSFCLSAL
jgi:hypothetical protein